MDFEALRDLALIITRNKTKQIELLDTPSRQKRLIGVLYDGIVSGAFQSDAEAAKHLYDGYASNVKYKKLKNRLIKQLINSAFFVDAKLAMFSERGVAFGNCQREFAAANILLGRNAAHAAIYLFLQVLEQAQRYEFTELSAEVTRVLRQIYGRSVAHSKKHRDMAVLHRECEEKRRWEIDALEYYDYVVSHYIGGRASSTEVFETTQKYFESLGQIPPHLITTQFYFYYYSIGIAHYMSGNRCHEGFELCTQGIEVLRQRQNATGGQIATFAGNRMICLTQTRTTDQKLAELAISELYEGVQEGQSNWYAMITVEVHYYFFIGQYASALALLEKAIKHPRFALQTGINYEIIKIFAGYLYLLARLDLLPMEQVREVIGDFSIRKFSNDFEVLNREKTGMNIPITMLPIIFNLLNGEFDSFVSAADALEKYRLRYLSNVRNLRSSSFMKLLFALSELPFRAKNARTRIKKHFNFLIENPIEIIPQSHAIEIIPYDVLWPLIEQRVPTDFFLPPDEQT
jgi:tetratricopeptide (TPR) repeat protein